MKRLVISAFFAFLLIFGLFSASVKPAHAYFSESSVLGESAIVCDDVVLINGVQVDSPQEAITVRTNTPTFSGCTNPNTQLELSLNGKELTTLETGNDGTWSYKLKKVLGNGIYTLSLAKNDYQGGETEPKTVATFIVVYTLTSPLNTVIPHVNLFSWNYFTLSLFVLFIVALLLIQYVVVKKQKLFV
jgi:hypothetical protein